MLRSLRSNEVVAAIAAIAEKTGLLQFQVYDVANPESLGHLEDWQASQQIFPLSCEETDDPMKVEVRFSRRARYAQLKYARGESAISGDDASAW